MLFNYFKLSVRLLIRNPFFTFINILGLSIGFAVFFTLWQHATYELKSDQFHKDHERIYRLYFDFYFAEGESWNHYVYSTIPPVLATLAKEKYYGIESLTRLIHQKNFSAVRWRGPQTDTAGWSELSTEVTLAYIDKNDRRHAFRETQTAYADPNFFEFFTLPLTKGQPNQVLNVADAIVLSESMATKYFGKEEPLGKTLQLNGKESFTVTGVFQDIPSNSHLKIDLLFSTLGISHAIERIDPFQETAVSYFKLYPDADIQKLQNDLVRESHLNWPFIKENFPGSVTHCYFQQLQEAPFHIFENDAYSPKSKMKLQIFMVVGIVVLTMAWINYLNLKLSTQASRMKELATRKVAGARVTDFIKQFLVESITISSISLLFAITIIQLFKSPLETFFEFYMPSWSDVNFQTLAVFIVVMAIGILVAGFHPALTMWGLSIRSAFQGGKLSSGKKLFAAISPIVQFIIAVTLIIWLVAVSNQVELLINNSWGLNREGVVVIDLPADDNIEMNKIAALENQLLSMADVKNVTVSTTVAGDLIRNRIKIEKADDHNVFVIPKSDGGVDERFVPFYHLKILAGRNFIKDNPSDKNAVIISKEAARSLGWDPEQAIGKTVLLEKHSWRHFKSPAEIIGVIEEHRYNPLYVEAVVSEANKGTVLTYYNHLFPKNQPKKLSVRLNGGSHLLETIRHKYEALFPGTIFHWYFLDDHMNVHYQNEQTARNQIALFSIIAIGIACLGLLGMISNKAVAKTKEIGIRKVLGARLFQICSILVDTTIQQILLATLVGIPLAHYLTQQYLQNFSERINLQWWHYALPVLILLVIMFATIASVLIKAARTNPVDSLRYE